MNESLLYIGLPLVLYLGLLLILGFRAARKSNSENEYLLGNRALSTPAFVATLVTTWYGGILGVGEFTYSYGISTWVVFGLPYYFFALLFAFFIAPRIRTAQKYSIPHMLYDAYGKPAGFLASIFLLFMTSPAPYILMLAILIQQWLGIGFISSVLAGTLFSIIYVYKGGFRSVVQTDKLQFVLMFSGFLLLFYYLITSPLSLDLLPQKLDALHKDFSGGMSWQEITVWFLIASWTFIDPGFHQRCSAAKNPQIARKGILISIAFWFVFDMLTLTCGLYAFAFLPEIEPLMSYPELARYILPSFFKGVFFTGLLATIMSTIDSYTFLSAMSFGRDLLWPFQKKESVTRWVRYGLIISAFISVLLILLVPSVIELWYGLGSIFIPPLLFPLIAVYFPTMRLKARSTFRVMLISFIITSGLFILNNVSGQNYLGVEPFFPGMIFSALCYFAFLPKKTTSANNVGKY